ncbi:MAG: hypothetical protein WA484_07150 [Solirubrobacteraceae bacterium]
MNPRDRGLWMSAGGPRSLDRSRWGVVRVLLVLPVVLAGVLVFGAGVVFASSAPSVNDRPAFASNVKPLGATLNGSIDPQGSPTSYHFVYGPTESYGSIVPVPDDYVPVNEAEDTVTQEIYGLEPGITYHFALVANSPAGTATGPDETFQTPAVPAPLVLTGGASEVGVGSVTLSGSVDPQGWEAGYYFQYGPTTSYGADWPGIAVTLGALTGAQSVISGIQNLNPGASYHYRLVASNPGGTVYGADQIFTTPEYPVSAIQQTPVLSADLGFLNPETTTGKSAGKSLTRAQRVANALKACKRKPRRQRAHCEKLARRK